MSTDPALNAAATPTVTVTASSPNGAVKAFNHDDGPHFSDVLDILNPLQHIPIINTIYQHLTSDTEGAVADVAGGTLWTGPLGLVTSLIDLAVKSDTGKSVSDNLLAWLGFEDDDEPVKAAQAQQAEQQQVQAQQEAVTSAPPAVTVQALAPLPVRQRPDARQEADRKSDKDGPAQIGNYMVFGASSAAPVSLTPPQPTQQTADNAPRQQGNYMVFGGGPSPAPAPTPAQPAAFQMASANTSAAQASAAYTKQGNYMVFGANSAPAPVPAPLPAATQMAAAASPLPPIGSSKVDAVANSVPNGGGPAQLSPLPQGRSFAAPARRNQVTPNALPMPTTGPAAAHGYMPSQAIPAGNGADSDSWFVQALNAGLDKYSAAQRLAGQDNMAASASAGAQSSTLH